VICALSIRQHRQFRGLESNSLLIEHMFEIRAPVRTDQLEHPFGVSIQSSFKFVRHGRTNV